MIPFEDVNLVAVLAATVASMATGFAWYSEAFFGKQWMKIMGMSKSDMDNCDMKKAVGTGFVATLISAYFLAVVLLWLHPSTNGEVVTIGAVAWLAMSLPESLHRVAWEQKPMQLVYINAGSSLVATVVTVLVLHWFG